MRGFDGYLSATADPYFRGDAESTALYSQPTELGASCAIVGSSGLESVPFLAAPTDTAPSYDVSSLDDGTYDVWFYKVSGIAVMGLRKWGFAYGSRNYGEGVYGGNEPVILDTPYYGVPVNSADIPLRDNSGSTVTIDAFKATYAGTVQIAAGKIRCHTSFQLNPSWGIWNRHNQRKIILKGGSNPFDVPGEQIFFTDRDWSLWLIDETLTGSLGVLAGRPTSAISRFATGSYMRAIAGQAAIMQAAIGWDSKNTPSGNWGGHSYEPYFTAGGMQGGAGSPATFIQPSFQGPKKVWPLVKIQGVAAGSLSVTSPSCCCLAGNELRGVLSCEWMG